MNNNSRSKTRNLVRLSIFIAFIMLQTWVPGFGYIPLLPGLNITYIHVTVILATLWLGTKEGVLIGTVWGVNSWIRALVAPPNPMYTLVFTSPLVSVVPRILMPLIVGLVAYKIGTMRHDKVRYALLGLLGAILNTAFVLGSIGIFQATNFAIVREVNVSQVWLLLGSIVLSNGIFEMIAAFIMTPIMMMTLTKLTK